MMKASIVILLFAVVFSSACMSSGSGGSGELTINSFYFNPDTILGNQKTFLNLEIQNGGTFPTINTTVLLYGMSADLALTQKLVSGEDATESDMKKALFGTLAPPSKDLGSGGEKRSAKWLVEFTGDSLKDQTLRQKSYVRICYGYRTESKGKVDFISDAEYLIKKEKGAISEGTTSFQSTQGPLAFSVEIPRPIIIQEGKETKFPVQLKITNIGSGFAVGSHTDPCNGLNTKETNKANLTVVSRTNGNQPIIHCPLDVDPRKNYLEVFLKRGDSRSQTIECTYHGPTNMPDVSEELQFLLNYGYYVDAESSVTVRGI